MSLHMHSANVAGRRSGMIAEEKRYDEGLEEIWRIKREIASEFSSLEDYFKSVLSSQDKRKRNGIESVRLPSRMIDGNRMAVC